MTVSREYSSDHITYIYPLSKCVHLQAMCPSPVRNGACYITASSVVTSAVSTIELICSSLVYMIRTILFDSDFGFTSAVRFFMHCFSFRTENTPEMPKSAMLFS